MGIVKGHFIKNKGVGGTGIYKKILEFVKIIFYLKQYDIFESYIALLWHLCPREGFILSAGMI